MKKDRRVRVDFTLPPDLLKELSDKLKEKYLNKSLFLKLLVREWLKNNRNNEKTETK